MSESLTYTLVPSLLMGAGLLYVFNKRKGRDPKEAEKKWTDSLYQCCCRRKNFLRMIQEKEAWKIKESGTGRNIFHLLGQFCHAETLTRIGTMLTPEVLQDLLVMRAGSGEWTPIHCAVTFSSPETVSAFVQLGADINARDGSGNTPLMMACSLGRLEMVHTLLSLGADPKISNSKLRTAFYLACLASSYEIVNAFFASADKKSALETTNHLEESRIRTSGDTTRNSAGEDDAVNHDGFGPHAVKMQGYMTQPDILGYTPFHVACWREDDAALPVVTLLHHNIPNLDINETAKDGTTALHRSTRADVVEYLIQHGCDVFAVDCFGNTVLHNACLEANHALVHAILHTVATTTPPHSCAKPDSADGDDAGACGKLDESQPNSLELDMDAAWEKYMHLFSSRSSSSALSSPPSTSDASTTAAQTTETQLNNSVKCPSSPHPSHNQSSHVHRLVQSQDYDGLTALHATCRTLHRPPQAFKTANYNPSQNIDKSTKPKPKPEDILKCIELLLEYGADPNSTDYGNCTPLYLAAMAAGNDVTIPAVKKLLEAGADASIETEQGWGPLHIAFHERDRHFRLIVTLMWRSLAENETKRAYLDTFSKTKARDVSNTEYHRRRGPHNRIPLAIRRAVLQDDHTVPGVASYISRFYKSQGRYPKTVVLVGAGMSVAAGIPDFRSQTTGLYANSKTRAAFDLDMFMQDPSVLWDTARECFMPVVRGCITPSLAHYMLAVLQDKGMLHRVFTQNVDMLEETAGVSRDRIVEAHGSFARMYCVQCHAAMAPETVWECVARHDVPKCSVCQALIRPDVVFFGEGLPVTFFDSANKDLKECELLLILGTSLVVYPFASLLNQVPIHTPRLLINRDPSGPFQTLAQKSLVETLSAQAPAATCTSSSPNATHQHPVDSTLKSESVVDSEAQHAATETQIGSIRAASTEESESRRLLADRDLDKSTEHVAGTARTSALSDSSSFRDALYLGDCDMGAQQLMELLGWSSLLKEKAKK